MNENFIQIILLVLTLTGTATPDSSQANNVKTNRSPPLLERLTDGRQHDRQSRYSPDGTRIAFTSTRGNKSHVFVMPARGGAATQVTPPDYSASFPSWSPDGKRIAFEANIGGGNGIWVVGIDGGEPVRVTPASMYASWGDWAPDGSRIAFISNRAGSMDVYTIPVAGGEPKQITNHKDNEWSPRWSPDSKRLAFYSTWEGRMTDVHVVSAEGGETRQVTDHPAEDYQPAWSPDGKWLAFMSRRTLTTQIWAVPAAGGKAVRLSDGRANLYGSAPDWAPDGKTIIFSKAPLNHLFSVSVLERKETQLTGGQADELSPVFSPDGTQILFSSTLFDAERNLTLMSSAGGKARPLTVAGLQSGLPKLQRDAAWSRGGRRIAFVQGFGGYLDSKDLWVMSAKGEGAKQLTRVGFVGNPVWCEADQSIVFTAQGQIGTDGNFNVAGGQIWKVPADGGTPTQLTGAPGNHTPTDYSPTLRQIIFHKAVDGVNKLFLMPVEGGEPRLFETGLKAAEGARWSPDGRQLAFISNDGARYELYVISVKGGPARRLTDSGWQKSAPSWSADGKRLVYSMAAGYTAIYAVKIKTSPLSN